MKSSRTFLISEAVVRWSALASRSRAVHISWFSRIDRVSVVTSTTIDDVTEVVRRYTFKLRPGTQARAALEREAGMARWVWNRCVAEDRDRRQAEGRLTGYDMKRELTKWRAEHEWLRQGSAVVQQETVLDWGRARKASSTVKGRGRPRFRSKRRWLPSLQYTRTAFVLRSGRLVLAKGVATPVIWSRALPGEPSSVRVFRDAAGWWWASFVVRRDVEPLPETGRAIGVDWGVKTIATTTSPQFDLEHPAHGRRSADTLASYQRRMARRAPKPGQRGSKGYRHAQRRAAVLHRKVAWQRRDHAVKWARRVVEVHDRIAVEDFRPKFMAKNRPLARRAADAAIGAAKRELLSRVEEAGRTVVLVPPAYTTCTCSECGARTKPLTLAQRIFACPACGYVADRDRNAARAILAAAGFNGACVESTRRDSPIGDRAA